MCQSCRISYLRAFLSLNASGTSVGSLEIVMVVSGKSTPRCASLCPALRGMYTIQQLATISSFLCHPALIATISVFSHILTLIRSRSDLSVQPTLYVFKVNYSKTFYSQDQDVAFKGELSNLPDRENLVTKCLVLRKRKAQPSIEQYQMS